MNLLLRITHYVKILFTTDKLKFITICYRFILLGLAGDACGAEISFFVDWLKLMIEIFDFQMKIARHLTKNEIMKLKIAYSEF